METMACGSVLRFRVGRKLAVSSGLPEENGPVAEAEARCFPFAFHEWGKLMR
jgi:hypothetical protein